MRTIRAIAAAAVTAAAAVLTLAVPASATTAPTCAAVTFTTTVSNRPDSSSHGDWAKDNFTRTTAVTCLADGSYRLNLTDKGTFTPLPGALSPSAGVPIQNLPFSGSFNGGMTFTVKSDTAPVDPKTGASGKYSSSEWAALVFPKGKIEAGAWGWTYSHCGETWKNAASGNIGDITGAKKCSVPSHTATPKPTTPAPVTSTSTATVPGKPVVVVTNPGQFQTVPNVSQGVATGDGSLS